MNVAIAPVLSRHSRRLLQRGAVLLLYAAAEGIAIPYFGSSRIGLSVHTLAAFEGALLLVLGLVWPKLVLGPAAAQLAFWFLVYSAVAVLVAYTLAAIWGVGLETIRLMGELPDGLVRGTPFQEGLIAAMAYSSASVLVSFALIALGLFRSESRA